ncbi:hypothetical protein NS330_15735, partial [Curtobacterium citreum]
MASRMPIIARPVTSCVTSPVIIQPVWNPPLRRTCTRNAPITAARPRKCRMSRTEESAVMDTSLAEPGGPPPARLPSVGGADDD